MPRPKPQSTDLAFYEGLIHSTAGMYEGLVEDDFEDIVQVLRLKAWQALVAFDARRSSCPREKLVFIYVKNAMRDLMRKRHRPEVYIEDQSFDGTPLDRFEAAHCALDADQVFLRAEEEMVVPATLSDRERHVLGLLYVGYSVKDAGAELGLSRNQMERAVKGVREKLADWRPAAEVPTLIAA